MGYAVIIDRVAVSVGNRVITESDISREIRVTAFLNGSRPDPGPASRRSAADRMVEQTLIRAELESSRYPLPAAAEVEPTLELFKREHSTDTADYQRQLQAAGITEQDLKEALLWQRTLLRFIEVRFRPAAQVTEQEIEDYFHKVVEPTAKAAHPGQPVLLDEYRGQIEETLTGQRADQEVDAWLKEARQRSEIVYHPEAFQ
jgi:hypothetical protein